MWTAIIAVMLLAVAGGLMYLATRIRKFGCISKHIKSKGKAFAVGLAVCAAVFAVLWLTLGIMNAMVCMLHAMLFWLICDGAALIVRKLTGRKAKRYVAGACAVAVTTVYLCVGAFFAHHVFRTQYDISSPKVKEPLKVVLFSDSHVGATFDWQEFSQYVEEMNEEQPDIVVIAGDYVDDDTSLENMEKSCEALGNLKTKYGVYFAFGNHDAGFYADGYRGYGKAKLIENLEKNHVAVLQDKTVNITGNIYLCGRQDSRYKDRADMEELMSDVPEDGYLIVLDHEPGDYEAQAKAGADLVLSGHTHGGQMIPINKVGEWIGVNDMTYGHEKKSGTDFVVSSGIGDWALDFKTGCISEYVVLCID